MRGRPPSLVGMPEPPVGAAIRPAPQGAFIDLEVTAGADRDAFPDGYNPWRRRLGIRVQERPERGRANRAVCEAVEAFLGLPRGSVTLAAGATSTQKTVRVAGLTCEELIARLTAVTP